MLAAAQADSSVWWHGSQKLDENVPVTEGRYLASVLPTCHTRSLEVISSASRSATPPAFETWAPLQMRAQRATQLQTGSIGDTRKAKTTI